MTEASRLVNASVEGMKAAHTGVQWCDDLSVDGDTHYFAAAAAAAVIRELAQNYEEFEELAREIDLKAREGL